MPDRDVQQDVPGEGEEHQTSQADEQTGSSARDVVDGIQIGDQHYTALLDVPYEQRKLIIVGAPPSVSAINLQPPPGAPVLAQHLFRFARGHPAAVIGGAVAGATVLGAYKAWQYFDVARKRKANVLYLSPGAAEGLEFPDGHPIPQVVYAGHPRLSEVYVPVSDFNLYLLQDRVAECVQLFRDLGAEEIDVTAEDDESAKVLRFAVDLPLTTSITPLPMKVGEAKADVELGASRRMLVREYVREVPAQVPFEPSKYLWLAKDPVLQDVVNSRLAGKLLETRVTIQSKRDFSISGSVEAALLKSGYNLGGDLRYAKSVRMALHIRFPKSGENYFRTLGQ